MDVYTKKTKSPKWSDAELEALLEGVRGNALLDRTACADKVLPAGCSNEAKVAEWQKLAEDVNMIGGRERTWKETRDKKIKWFSKVKTKIILMNKQQYDEAGNYLTLTPLEEKVRALLPNADIAGEHEGMNEEHHSPPSNIGSCEDTNSRGVLTHGTTSSNRIEDRLDRIETMLSTILENQRKIMDHLKSTGADFSEHPSSTKRMKNSSSNQSITTDGLENTLDQGVKMILSQFNNQLEQLTQKTSGEFHRLVYETKDNLYNSAIKDKSS